MLITRLFALMILNSSCNRNLFEEWVERFLIKELKHGQYVVMDKAALYKSKRTEEFINSIGSKVTFLPPYSPDLNSIEKFWDNMKRWIKERVTEFVLLYKIIVSCFNESNAI